MKRGLKATYDMLSGMITDGYNRYPDEKGTESCFFYTFNIMHIRVTTATPMKRGLKDVTERIDRSSPTGYNRYPDEKGTESQM